MANRKNLKFNRFRRFLKTDRAVLVISIGIALFFWFFTKMSKEYETTRTVEVEYILPEGKTFLETPPDKLRTSIKGKGWNLLFSYLRGRLPSVKIPLDSSPDQYLSSASLVNKLATTIDAKYKVLSVDSDMIHIRLDENTIKKVPLKLRASVAIKNGFMAADSLQLIPDSVTIAGPRELVNVVDEYYTEEVNIEDVSGAFSQKIDAEPSNNPQLKVFYDQIIVTQNIEKYTEGEIGLPIQITNQSKDSISILPKNVFITYRAPLSVFAKIGKNDFSVNANITSSMLKGGNNTMALELSRQPEFCKIVAINPATIEYYIVKKTEEEKKNQ